MIITGVWLTASGCGAGGPTKSEIKEALQGRVLELGSFRYRIGSIDEIKKVKIEERNETELGLECLVNVELETEEMKAEANVAITYMNLLDMWLLEEFTILNGVVEPLIEPTGKEISDYVRSGDANWMFDWQFADGDVITTDIISITPSSNGTSSNVTATIAIENDYSKMMADAGVLMVLDQQGTKLAWEPIEMEVLGSSYSVLNPISDEDIAASLEYMTLSTAEKEHWQIENMDEIQSIEVLERTTDLEKGTDEVTVNVLLQKENVIGEGNLKLSYSIPTGSGQSGSWELEGIDVDQSFTRDVMKEMVLDEKRLLKDLYDAGVVADILDNMDEVLLHENTVKYFNADKVDYDITGNMANVAFDLIAFVDVYHLEGYVAHFDCVATDGDNGQPARITYSLEDGEWRYNPVGLKRLKVKEIGNSTAQEYLNSQDNYLKK